MRALSSTRNQGILALALIVVFYLVGWLINAPDVHITAGDFGGILYQLAATWQVRSILVAIGVDALLGMLAALRVNQFDSSKVSNYIRTMIVPFIFGYILIALLTSMQVTALVYASIMASVVGSIIDNLIRSALGTSQPHDAIVNNLPPAEPHA